MGTVRRKEKVREEIKRWEDIYHYGFGYTRCPYCGDETEWYNPASSRPQSDLKNNQRAHCPKCGKRVYAREGWLMNQPEDYEANDELFELVRGNYSEVNKEYIQEQIRAASEYLTDKQKEELHCGAVMDTKED